MYSQGLSASKLDTIMDTTLKSVMNVKLRFLSCHDNRLIKRITTNNYIAALQRVLDRTILRKTMARWIASQWPSLANLIGTFSLRTLIVKNLLEIELYVHFF